MNFFGTISTDVMVERISIQNTGIEIPVESLRISVENLPPSNDEAFYNAIEATTYGAGIFVDSSIYKVGFSLLEGFATKDIEKVSFFSLNDDCVVISENNYKDFVDLEASIGEHLYKPQRTTNIAVGDRIAVEYFYVISEPGDENVLLYDGVIGSIGQEITCNGNEYVRYLYIPSIRSAEFLIVHLLTEVAEIE